MQNARFSVRVRWPGNPDYSQHADIAVPQTFEADTLTALVATVQAAISFYGAGSGNFAPEIVQRDGVGFCTISYNGRCWRLFSGVVNARSTEVLPAEVDAQVARDIAFAKQAVKTIKSAPRGYPENDTSNNLHGDE